MTCDKGTVGNETRGLMKQRGEEENGMKGGRGREQESVIPPASIGHG